MFANPEKILIQAGLSRGETVADLGTGSGYYSLNAAKITGMAGKVFVVDILESALSHVSAEASFKGYRNVQTLRCDLELPSACKGINDGVADFVIMANIVHQLANRDNLMTEVYRILKTGGRLLIVDWNEELNPIGPLENSRVTEEEAKQLAQSINLRFANSISPDPYHYGLLFVK